MREKLFMKTLYTVRISILQRKMVGSQLKQQTNSKQPQMTKSPTGARRTYSTNQRKPNKRK